MRTKNYTYEKEKRSFIQFNFKTAEEAKKLKFQINTFKLITKI